jgi:hypothetical protein
MKKNAESAQKVGYYFFAQSVQTLPSGSMGSFAQTVDHPPGGQSAQGCARQAAKEQPLNRQSGSFRH